MILVQNAPVGRSWRTCAMLAVVLLLGCDPSQEPLIFGSSNILGVDLSISPSNTQPVTATLGYKSFDLSIVPVTTKSSAGAPNPIRGCFVNGDSTLCPTDATAPTAALPQPPPSAQVPTSSPVFPHPAVYAALDVGTLPEVKLAALPVPPTLRPGVQTAAPTGGASLSERSLSNAPAPNALSVGASASNMRDALSVYSSFNSGNTGGTSTQSTAQSVSDRLPTNVNLNLGKVFATGVAAQFLSYGQYSYLQLSAATQCIKQLSDSSTTGKVSEDTMKLCGGPAQSITGSSR
jgi:hypothetical protein